MAKPEDIRLGQILIRKRWCTLRQVNEGIEAQKQLREDGRTRSLGWVLVKGKVLEAEQLKMALSEIGQLRLVCPSCRRDRPISRYSSDARYECKSCKEKLILDGESEEGSRSSDATKVNLPLSPRSPSSSQILSSSSNIGSGRDGSGGVDDDAVLGKVIGGCQILERLASGGMGVVYKAKQLKLGRIVAVKVLSEDLARDRKYVHRFLREAQSAAELNHGNIVHIIDVGEINSIFYIIMEFVDGSNLRDILDVQNVLDAERVLEIALQASQALQHAHKRGIIHRDIKPENIMITREGIVKIADLGLAKKIHPDRRDKGITQTKAIMGTPYYMGPEQIKDFREVDGRTDIYSLGVTMFRALTGQVPFDGRTPVEVMIKVVEGKRPKISSLRQGIPADVEALVDKMMERNPDNRFQTFTEVMRGLDSALRSLSMEDRQRDSEQTPT